MKILTILNDENEQKHIEILDYLQEENEVEVINLKEGPVDYEEIVKKIEQCDKVISW